MIVLFWLLFQHTHFLKCVSRLNIVNVRFIMVLIDTLIQAKTHYYKKTAKVNHCVSLDYIQSQITLLEKYSTTLSLNFGRQSSDI